MKVKTGDNQYFKLTTSDGSSDHSEHPNEDNSLKEEILETDQDKGFFRHILKNFSALNSCPRELSVLFLLKFCESYGYFALSQILVIYLHQEFGLSDIQAGAVYGLWGAAITFWGFVTACFNDQLGVRVALLIGFCISGFSSVILALTFSKTIVFVTLFGLLPIGNSIGIPMLTIGIKRCTTTQNRGFAFGLFYAIMNIAALVSGPVVDFFNIMISPKGKFTGNRMVIVSVVINYCISWMVTFWCLREMKVHHFPVSPSGTIKSSSPLNSDNDHHGFSPPLIPSTKISIRRRKASSKVDYHLVVDESLSHGDDDSDDELETIQNDPQDCILHPIHNHPSLQQNNSHSSIEEQQEETSGSSLTVVSHASSSSAGSIVKELLFSPTFWRFVVLTLFLINLRTIFRHVDATLPTYLVRTFGENYPKGMIYSINPFLIIWLTPIVAAFTSTWPHFDMIKYGGYISAISPFFMVFSNSTWAVVMFMILLSIGEAVWSPRLYDYTMSIAPDGKEATFSSLAAAPIFAAKIPVGFLSGYLISTYLPENSTEKPNGQMLWLIIGLLTLSSPLLISLFEPWIREPETVEKPTHSHSPSDDVGIEMERMEVNHEQAE